MSRRVLVSGAVALALSSAAGPARAGFLDELFGIRPQPRYVPVPVAPDRDPLSVTVKPRRQQAARPPAQERPTERVFPMEHRGDERWYLRDRTLAKGDIVVLRDRIVVFDGGVPTASAFRPFETSGVLSDRARRALRQMVATPRQADQSVWEPAEIMRSHDRNASVETAAGPTTRR